jgi:hypothetical protein
LQRGFLASFITLPVHLFEHDPSSGLCHDMESVLGVDDRGVWLRIATQKFEYSRPLSCALVQGCGAFFRHHYRSVPKRAGQGFRDEDVVPYDLMVHALDGCTVGKDTGCTILNRSVFSYRAWIQEESVATCDSAWSQSQ